MSHSILKIIGGATVLALASAPIAHAQQTPPTRFAPFAAPMGEAHGRTQRNRHHNYNNNNDDKNSYTVVDALGRRITIQGPRSAAGLIANQGIYGGNVYGNTTITSGVVYPYPYGYGYPQPYPYGYPYGVQQPGYIAPIAPPLNGYDRPPAVSVFPSYGAGYGYPTGGYPYPVPVPVYPYGGYGYGPNYSGSYSSTTRTSGYGVGIGNGGVNIRLGNNKTRTRTTTEVYGR